MLSFSSLSWYCNERKKKCVRPSLLLSLSREKTTIAPFVFVYYGFALRPTNLYLTKSRLLSFFRAVYLRFYAFMSTFLKLSHAERSMYIIFFWFFCSLEYKALDGALFFKCSLQQLCIFLTISIFLCVCVPGLFSSSVYKNC